MIRRDLCDGFRFAAEHAFEFERRGVIAKTAVSERIEVARVVAEAVQGIAIGDCSCDSA